MNAKSVEPLSEGELLTLRRIANGAAVVPRLRQQDVVRLTRLKLIEISSRGLRKTVRLTELGRRRYYARVIEQTHEAANAA